jgi:hypothetical protein
MSLQTLLDEDRRLVVLRCLSEAHDYSLNESLLGKLLERQRLGLVGRDVMRGHLHWLEEQRLVKVERLDVGEQGKQLWVAKLTTTGQEVAKGRPWPGVGRPSTIDRLPPEIREEIGRLRDRGKSIDEILKKLRELTEEPPSRSALGRHVQKLDQLGEKLRRSRSLAEGLAQGLGDKPVDTVTRASIELLHDAIFDVLQDAAMAEGEEGEELRRMVRNPRAAALLAETIERLTKASRHNVELVEKIEARATKKAKEGAAKAAEAAGREQGLSTTAIAAIKRHILGLKA